MAVYFKNATVDVALPEKQGDTQAPVSRTVHIQPMAAQAAYDQFGVNVENTFLLMDETDGIGYYQTGGRVIWDSKTYSVAADPKLWQHGLPTDHVEVVLSEVN